jgi:hypothetical protein
MAPHDTAYYLPSNHVSALVTWLVLAGLWCGGPLLVVLHLAARMRRERADARADAIAEGAPLRAGPSIVRGVVESAVAGRSSASPSGKPARRREPRRGSYVEWTEAERCSTSLPFSLRCRSGDSVT